MLQIRPFLCLQKTIYPPPNIIKSKYNFRGNHEAFGMTNTLAATVGACLSLDEASLAGAGAKKRV